jgi:hypothetical protein
MRRRRASGGPAEHAFATLVGLELRPRRLREAAALWHLVAIERSIIDRDQLWDHPDLLPDADALADPATFAAPASDTEWDISRLADTPPPSDDDQQDDASGNSAG